jgi:predicted nucleic acid-binding protein
LDNIDALDILGTLYQKIFLTEEVAAEFGKPLASWMTVLAVKDQNYLRILNASVDLGEASTIALALQMPEDNVMILDGVLLKAKQQHAIVSVGDVLVRLKQANFRISEDLEKEVLKLAGEC